MQTRKQENRGGFEKFGTEDDVRAILDEGETHPRYEELMAHYDVYNREMSRYISEYVDVD